MPAPPGTARGHGTGGGWSGGTASPRGAAESSVWRTSAMRPESGYPWVHYGLAVASVASTLLVGLAIGPALGGGPPLVLLLAAVILAAGYGGLRPALAA